jgi:hypothetical protein
MTIELQQISLSALDISSYACPSQRLEVEMIPAFRRTCSAPGCLSTSTQENIEIHRSWENNHLRCNDNSSCAESRSTSELRHLRALRDTRRRKIKKDAYPRTFSRSRSCGFEDISDISSYKDQEAILTSESRSHGGMLTKNYACGSSSNCSLNDASPDAESCCFSGLTAHDAAALGVDIPSHRPTDSLEFVTWNLASPNNNPFEFWVRSSKYSRGCPNRSHRRAGCLAGDPRG